MKKVSFLKLIVVLIIALIISGSGYAGWRIWEDIKKTENQTNQNLVKETGESATKTNEIETLEINTSDWGMYRNKKHKFEIRYPKEWVISNTRKPSETNITYLDNLYLHPSNEEFPPMGVTIWVKQTTITKFLQELEDGGLVIGITPKNINGLSWSVLNIFDKKSQKYNIGAATPKGESIFYLVTPSDSQYQNPIFDKILSTFKFPEG